MPINREPESLDEHAPEESAVRRAPLDQDDAYELADHEYTLVADADDSRGWPYDEHTAPWSTLPPLPPWATKARALLEPPTLPRPLNDETPTLVEEGDPVSATALRALRTELGELLRDADARAEQVEQLERSLANAVQARAEAELRNGVQAAELQGRVQGQALRIADLEEELRDARAAREAREARFASELRELLAARDASEAELQDDVRQLRAARDAREAELEEEVRELEAVHEVRAAALDELRAENATLEARLAELETERRALKSTKKARATELDQLRASDAAKTARVSELEAQLSELRADRDARTTELEAQLSELRADRDARTTELEAQLHELEAARNARATDFEQLRDAHAAQTARVAQLEDELRALKAAQSPQVSELEHELRELQATHDTRVDELEHALTELRAERETRSAELEQLRERYAARATRVIELEHEMQQAAGPSTTTDGKLDEPPANLAGHAPHVAQLESELRAFDAYRDTQAQPHAPELEAPIGIASDSEADIATTVEWITNAPPGLEVTIEVDANEDAEVLVSAQPAQVNEAAPPETAAIDSELVAELATLDASPAPRSPETTIEIDPDRDLLELDAALPPVAAEPAAAESSKPRKPRPPTPPRDDLKRIDGIGKGLEQRLYAKGIRTYAQLASLRPAEVTRLAKQIGVTPDRIANQSWIPQARRLKPRAGKTKTTSDPKTRKRKPARA